ncbi:MAG: GxxExxY protein [bacterium]|nr:GxxExxY protein [bacterium]
MDQEGQIRRKDLVHADLSYRVVGILFEVFNELGYGHLERVYQRAIAELMRKLDLHFQEQVRYTIQLKNRPIASYVLDFLIEGKVVLELKRGARYMRKDIEQVYAYLRASDLQLGILATFTSQGVAYKRIVNIEHPHS